jgi:hypothetical protein
MLKQESSLGREMLLWILGGFALVFLVPLLVKPSLCPPKEPNIWTIKGERNPAHNEQGSNGINNVLVAEQKQTADNQNKGNTNYLRVFPQTWFCDESRFTDFLIAYFTYCLVIIGWFGIRSNERLSRNLERAFIFGTPHIDSAKTVPGGNIFIEIVMHNTGRTAGTVKVIYGEVSPNVEPFGEPVYAHGSTREANGMLPPTLGNAIRAPVTFECPVTADFYFFGYIDYDDLFRRPHTSRFCAKIFIDGSGIEAAGNDAFNDWN